MSGNCLRHSPEFLFNCWDCFGGVRPVAEQAGVTAAAGQVSTESNSLPLRPRSTTTIPGVSTAPQHRGQRSPRQAHFLRFLRVSPVRDGMVHHAFPARTARVCVLLDWRYVTKAKNAHQDPRHVACWVFGVSLGSLGVGLMQRTA